MNKEKYLKSYIGSIHVHPRGFAFVTVEDPNITQDVFIPKHLTKGAMNGDKVEISVSASLKKNKGPEGSVLFIIERSQSELMGSIVSIDKNKRMTAYVHSLGPKRKILLEIDNTADYNIGDRILMEILDWGDEESPLVCKPMEKMGSMTNPSIDIPAAIKEFNLRDAFLKDVIKEAKSFGKDVTDEDRKGRGDFTGLECFTIDPDTAKDFDDALSITRDEKGEYHLGVHIADVSHYVKPGTKLDEEARMRCNSTYFPGTCIPMLPEELSNHLCSLKENVIRLCISVFMDFDAEGNLLRYKILPGYIYSQKRFTYSQAKKIIDGEMESKHKPSLHKMVELCNLLKAKRAQRGCVDLAMPEVVLQFDKKGMPYDYKIVEYDITHQLVEEFMLKANEIVATDLIKQGKNVIFRIHESPATDNLNDFYALARTFGFQVPANPSQEDIQKLFVQAKTSPYQHQISVAFVRSMKLAIYSEKNVGHYGLSLENYCHFTSPIRRYSDLIIHRLLFAKKKGDDLKKVAKECSDRERVSFRAESSVLNLKKLRYFKEMLKENPNKKYTATVSRTKPFGLFFEISPIQMEGFIHISEIGDDYFEFNEKNQSLHGRDTGKKYHLGDTIQVTLERIDLIYQESEWNLVQEKKKRLRRKKKN